MLVKYEEHHIHQCLDLFLDIFKNEPWNYDWICHEKILRYFTDLKITPGFLGLLYYKNHQFIGFCFGIINDYFTSKIFEIKEICIKRDLQGHGNGSHMLEEISKFLIDINVQCITLSTQKNIKAFEFYNKNGYIVSKSTVFMSKYF